MRGHDPIRRPRPTTTAAPTLAASRRHGVLVAWLLWFVAGAAVAETLDGMALVEALRGGGYTLYFRHAATDWSQQDRVVNAGDWVACDPARMRQLSAAGRSTARAVGDAMRALRVPVGRVLASPYCRTRETARLLDLGPVEASDDVVNLRAAAFFGGRDAVVATARRLLATVPAAGTNTVVVAHGNVAREATPVYPGEAEGVVFAPDGDGGFRFVGRLEPRDWQALAAVAGD